MSAELIAKLRWLCNVTRMGTAQESVTDCAYMWQAADALEAAEAENARLRADMVRMFDDMKVTATERDAAEAKLAKIDAEHQPWPMVGNLQWCRECNARLWPCPTHRILHPADQDEGQIGRSGGTSRSPYPDNEGDET